MARGEPLSPGEGFDFSFVPVPTGLIDSVNTLYAFSLSGEGMEDVMPSYCPQLMLFGQGTVRAEFASGTQGPAGGAFVVTQLPEATRFAVHGPARMIGVSINMRGWAQLSGLSAKDTLGNILPVSDAMPRALAEQLADICLQIGDPAQDEALLMVQVGEILQDHLRPLAADHDQFIQSMLSWLNDNIDPKLDDLPELIGRPPRTIQRWSNRFFGAPPAALAKQSRAIQAATILSIPDVSEQMQAEILEAFYDQSHLIHDIRRYTGRTPARLGGEGTLSEITLGPDGYPVPTLFEQVAASELANRE